MKITKLGHSCVLVETPDRVGLFDPGVWADRSLIDAVKHVDRIIYTHEHPDHFDVEILKSLLERFPQAHVVCNEPIKQKIEEAGVDATIREETECTRKFEAPHEQTPWPNTVPPSENGYHFKDLFTSPGDSHSFNESKKVLAIAYVAPWGKTSGALDRIVELKPEYILPIHDWHLSKAGREYYVQQLSNSLESHGIKVLPAESGIVHEIE